MNRVTDDALLYAIERLESALSAAPVGYERTWAEKVSGALEDVEQVLREYTVESGASDGPFSEVDLTRPSLVRRVSALRRDLALQVGKAHALHTELDHAAEAFTARPDKAEAAGVPEPARQASVPDFGSLRQRLEQLLAALLRLREGEAELVLESVTTDLGAGD